MSRQPITTEPRGRSYDVVIIGGAVMGSSVAWFLSVNPDFDGTVLVIERDPTYANSSTARTNSCMRQQFSNEVNVRISQFGAEFVANFQSYLGDDPEVPELAVHHFGYLFLADSDAFADELRASQRVQAELGAGTVILEPAEILDRYPFYALDDIVCGSLNTLNEGYFDSGTMFDWWRKKARDGGVEYVTNEVVAIDRSGDTCTGVRLGSGESISCGMVVNAAGPRAAEAAALAGLRLPVEPRKRFTFLVDIAESLPGELPLTIDPTGVHVRTEGSSFVAGCAPEPDPAADPDDLQMDHDIWEEKLWPTLADRIPAFERAKVAQRWAGHYAFNTLDQNVIVGPHHEVRNFLFVNGFSGHGMQQSPAMGRGLSEWIAYGEYRSLDLSPLGYDRVANSESFVETAVI